MKSENKTSLNLSKERISIWLGIGNFILTIIIGVVLAFYFKIRDENFQNKLLETQAIIQNQSELANVNISKTCFYNYHCGNAILIINNGPAIANDLKITVNLTGISTSWQDYISSVEAFQVVINPASLTPNISTAFFNTKNGKNDITGNNTIIISIDSLPPNQPFEFYIEYDHKPYSTIGRYETREVTISNDTENEFSSSQIEQLISDYLERKYIISSFEVNASCENCIVNDFNGYIFDSAANGWGMTELSKKKEGQKEVYSTKITSLYFMVDNSDDNSSSTNTIMGIPFYIDLPITDPPIILNLTSDSNGYKISE